MLCSTGVSVMARFENPALLNSNLPSLGKGGQVIASGTLKLQVMIGKLWWLELIAQAKFGN